MIPPDFAMAPRITPLKHKRFFPGFPVKIFEKKENYEKERKAGKDKAAIKVYDVLGG